MDAFSLAIKREDWGYFNCHLKVEGRQWKPLDKEGFGLLHVAVIHKRTEMLTQLLQNKERLGLDINLQSTDGLTAWQYALQSKYAEGIKLLVDNNCDLSSQPQVLENTTATPRRLSHPIKERYWPAKICEEAVRKKCTQIVAHLNPSTIVPRMFQNGVFSQQELKKIIDCNDVSDKVMIIISILHRKGKDGYREFFSALRHDQEHQPHRAIGEELDELCQKLVEESQKTSDKKEVDFRNGTVYTGSDSSETHTTTTPRTLDSINIYSRTSSISRPDSGLGLPPSGPSHCSSNSSQCSDRHPLTTREVRKQLIASDASNFDKPHIQSGQREPIYPVYQSALIESRHKRSLRDLEEKEHCRNHVVLRCGRVMVPNQAQSYSNITEESSLDSDVEKDRARELPYCNEDESDSDDEDLHRVLAQVLPVAALEAMLASGTTMCCETSFNDASMKCEDRRSCPVRASNSASCSPSSHSSLLNSHSSTPPIDIPSRHSPKMAVPEPPSSSSPSPANLLPSDVLDTSSSDSPKVLHHPTVWERVKRNVKSYFTSGASHEPFHFPPL